MDTEAEIKKVTKEFEKDLIVLTNEISKEVSKVQDDSEIVEDNQSLFSIKNGDYQYNFEWKKVIFDLPIPQFTMKERKLSFDIPEVVMKVDEICFDWPKTEMVDKQVAIKPETTCEWKIGWRLGIKTKFWDCTTRDTPIIIKVPEITMETKCIATKIPQVTMKTKEIIIDIPEVTVIEKRIIFKTLVITSIQYEQSEENIDNSSDEINKIQQKITHLSSAYEQKMKHLQINLTNEKFDEAQNQILEKIAPDILKFENGIKECKSAITDLKNNGATAQLKLEEKKLNQLISDLNKLMAPYEESLRMLNEQRQLTLQKLQLT